MNVMLRAAFAALLFAISQAGLAATAMLSDPGSDFDVYYDTDELDLFGTPFLVNNTVFFLPDNFRAESYGGTGAIPGDGRVDISETIHLHLIAKDSSPGFSFESLFLEERGDYIIDGPGTSVTANAYLSVFDITAPFDESTATFSETFEGTVPDNSLHEWTGNLAIDTDSGDWSGGREIILTLQNNLTAETTLPDTYAMIQKKFAGVQINVNPVPVPAAVWLFGSALAGLAGFRRRRRN